MHWHLKSPVAPGAGSAVTRPVMHHHHHHHHHHRVTWSLAGHSCLHKFTPLGTVLRTLPRRVEAEIVLLEVELNRSKPGSSWSTRWAMPVNRQTTDGCSQSTCVVLGWTSTSNVSEQTQPSGRDKVSGWWLAGPASDLVVHDVCYIWNTHDMTKAPLVENNAVVQ